MAQIWAWKSPIIRTHEISFYFQGEVVEVTFVGANPKNSAENRVSINDSFFYEFKSTSLAFHLRIPLKIKK